MTVQAATPVGVLRQHHGDVAASKHPLGVDTGRAYHARRAARSAYKRGTAAASRPTRWTTAVALLMTAAIAQPAHAGAGVITISPGDRIATGTSSCTLGYAYTGQADHTYAISRSENQNPLRKQLVELRLDPSGPGAAAVAELLGVELPTKVSTYAKSADTTVIWLGPDEWLVTDTALTGPELEARPCAAVTPHGGAAVDVSGQRTNLRLRGSHSRDVLAKGCALDLHPRVFGAGAAAESMLGRAGVILLAVDGRGGDYRILVCPSFGRYLAD